MSFASHGAKAAAAIGAAAIYRKMREPARQNSPFRRAWELNLRLALGELDSLAYESEAPGDLTSSSDVADPGRPAAKPFVYVALGDSAAQGLGASSIARGYVPRIAAGLEAALDRRVILLNISLSGGTAESVLASQMPLLSGLQAGSTAWAPDLVTLDIGGNDVSLQRLSVEDFSSLIDTICRGLPRPAVVANIPTFKPLASAERAALLSKAIDDAAKENRCGLVVKVVPPGHFEVHSWDPHSDLFFPCGAHQTPPPLSTITTADSRGPRYPDPDMSLRLRDRYSHLAIWAGMD